MTNVLTAAGWVLLSAAAAAFVWFVLVPWVPPLYRKYRAWVESR